MKIDIGRHMIRDWARNDAADLARVDDNPRIAANLRDRFPSPYSLPAAETYLAGVTSQTPRTAFAIATATTVIGGIGLMPGQDVHRFSAELGYWLGESYWGNGIMTSAVCALVSYGFREFSLNRIYAEPYAANVASIRVLEKAGFSLEGRLRASVVKNGKVLDQFLYAMVNPELG